MSSSSPTAGSSKTGQEGVEPPTFGFGDRRSAKLSYWANSRFHSHRKAEHALLAPNLVYGMRTLLFAELLQAQLRCALSDTDARTIVSFAALAALEPDILPFTLFGHKVRSHQAGPPRRKHLFSVRRPTGYSSLLRALLAIVAPFGGLSGIPIG